MFDQRSMDDTALLAVGILMEELAELALGETGDLVLVEGERISDDDEGGEEDRPSKRQKMKATESDDSGVEGNHVDGVLSGILTGNFAGLSGDNPVKP